MFILFFSPIEFGSKDCQDFDYWGGGIHMGRHFLGFRRITGRIAGLIVLPLLWSASALAGSNTVDEMFYDNSSGSPVFELIDQAKSTIDIEIYEMGDVRVLTGLKNAVDRGVRVRVVEEAAPVGASCRLFSAPGAKDDAACQQLRDLVSYVNDHGGSFVPFQLSLCGTPGSRCYEHGKIVIVDGDYALLSTGNFNATNLCDKTQNPKTCNRDYSVVSTNKAVISTLENVFENDLNGTTTSPSEMEQNPYITVSPQSLKPLVAFIATAKKTLQIQNQYLKDPTLNQAIIDAANRGVQVFVMVESFCGFGAPKPTEIAQVQKIYGAFDQAKINTRIFNSSIKVAGVSGYLHAKAIIVDSDSAWVGSVNGSTTSLSDNREYGIFLDNETDVQQLAKFMYDDYMNPNAETWQESLQCKKDHGGSSVTPPDGFADDYGFAELI